MRSSMPAPHVALPAWPVRRWRGLPRWCAALALVAVAAYAGHEVALHTGIARLSEAAVHRLDMLAGSLDADLARFDYLPALLETNPVVPALLDSPSKAAHREAVNRYLNGVNATAGAEMLYVLDAGGVSLAASDWDQPGTTIGQDLSFRPYVSDAVKLGRGRFYGVGITSRKPGYYLSYALRRGDGVRGVAAVKVNIAEAEDNWRKLPGQVLLIDERGVVILSTRDDLRYRPVAPLDAAQRAEVQRTRPYGEAQLEPLRWTRLQALTKDSEVVKLDASSSSRRSAPCSAPPPGGWSRSRTWHRSRWRRAMPQDGGPRHGGAGARRRHLVAAPACGAPEAREPRRAAGSPRQPRVDGGRAHRAAARGADELVHAGKLAALGRCRPAWCMI